MRRLTLGGQRQPKRTKGLRVLRLRRPTPQPEIPDPPHYFDKVLEFLRLHVISVGAEVTLGAGSPACNASALRRSLTEAQVAFRIARSQRRENGVVRATQIGSHTQLLQLLRKGLRLSSMRGTSEHQCSRQTRNHGSAFHNCPSCSVV